MSPVVLLKTAVDIGALDTTLEVGSNSSPSEQSAIQQCVKTQQAIQESLQRAVQTFRAAPALQAFLAAQAAADGQCLMGPVAAFKEQIAAAQAHIAPRIDSRWKEDQERARRLAASFQPRIDSRWKETQERLQTPGAPLKAIHERVREAFQLFQPIQHEVLRAKKAFQGLAAPYQALFQAWQAQMQPFLEQMTAIQAPLALLKDDPKFQEGAQRTRDIITLVRACCPLYRESDPEHQQEEINAALTRLIAQLYPGLRNPRAAQALRQKAATRHTSTKNFLRTEVFPTAIRLVASEVTSSRRMRVGRKWVTNRDGKVLVVAPWGTPLTFQAFTHWFFSQVYGAAAAIVLDDVYPRPTTQQAQVVVYEEDALERLTVPASASARDSAMLTALLQAEERDPADQLHRLLTIASPRARELFRLLRQKLSIKEAAAVLGMSPATAYVHIYRTRAKGRRR
jgi:DNA-binding CsgD family transcriptional regulator